MKVLRKIFVGVVAVFCVACSQTPVRYYSLIEAKKEEGLYKPVTGVTYFELMPIGVPTFLDQPQMVVRTASNGIEIKESDRWGNPLSEEMRLFMSNSLSRRLNATDVYGLTKPAVTNIARVRIQVRSFDVVVDEQVKLLANWSVTPEAGKPSAVCSSRFTAQARGGMSGVVHAQQQVLETLAQVISTAVSQPNATCP